MKVRELLSSPEKWTKYAGAKNLRGYNVHPHSCCAVCWCLLGAVNVCYPNVPAIDLLGDGFATTEQVARWNDAPERTFEDIRKLVEELDI